VDKGVVADIDAPLSHWEVARPFDSADPCDATQKLLVKENSAKIDRDNPPDYSSTRAVAIRFVWSQCIATDDPRLKEK
jgi:hypothetical protein